MKRRTSIEDVAKRANASITSVSRVMNDADYPVSEALRGRIIEAIRDLHYTPNSAAQGLRRHFSPVIGIVVRDISNTYFGEIARGATDEALRRGYLTFICDTGRDPVNELEIHEMLWKNRVRGIVLVGGGFDDDSYRRIIDRQVQRSRNYGLRLISNAPQGVKLPTISIDFAGVIDTVVSYLVEHGHTRIALITGQESVYTCREHVAGYARAMRRAGVEESQDMIAFQGFTESGGYEAARTMLQRSPRPTAFCCASDLIAVGAMRAIHEAGMRVPDDVSLVGVGDSTIAPFVRPALTSVRVPRYEMGSRGVDYILSENPDPECFTNLPTELVVRDSVRRRHP